PGPAEERDHLVRLTDSLSRGVWPTYARLACALNLLALRAMHAQLCDFLASLIWRPDYRARAPLAARVCGAVPFHPAGAGGQALGSTEQDFLADSAKTGRRGNGGDGDGDGSSASSSTFYSAFLHPLYVWAQCLDRQFYAQAHRPRISPAHHLVPRRRGRAISRNSLMVRATGGVAPVLVPTAANQPWARPNVGSKGRYESTMVSPGAQKRECCPYLFQRGMLVSDEGVRGGQDHLRSDEAWPEEDSEERVAYQMLNGVRMANGGALASVP
ncbi:unnamed protein product, partial [Laminaria digitata]